MTERKEILNLLQDARRVVLKVGSSLIAPSTSDEPGTLDRSMIKKLRDEILYLRGRGKEVILVSSGAVAMGRSALRETIADYHPRTNPGLSRKQALAAVGQARLISLYGEVFAERELAVAQILITARDFSDRNAYLNIGHTLSELLRLGIIPIINENDTVSTEELRFGDNDLLSAACAALLHSDLLILLTSVDGFQMNGRTVPLLNEVSDSVFSAAGGPSGPGSGGMRTKVRAGKLGLQTGFRVAILPGFHPAPVQALFAGDEIGTLIGQSMSTRMNARKKWLLFVRSKGALLIDDGAAGALRHRGSSLLSAGIREVRGVFGQGDVVEIMAEAGASLGRGIVRVGSRQVEAILKSNERQTEQPGARGPKVPQGDGEIIHRNDLIMEAE